MKNFVIKILTVLFIVSFIIAIPVSIVKSHIEESVKNMTLDAMYICKDDHDLKIKFTETFGNTPEGYLDISAYSYDARIAYLYVDDKEYYGLYHFDLADKLNKVIYMTFYDGNFEQGKGISLQFDYSKKKLTILSISYFKNGFVAEDAFENDQIFIKKTWWNTWGLKLCIILIIAFIVWLVRIPEFIKNGKYREDTIKEFKESKKE